jgi:metallo-beta-lactamase family protein
MNVRVKFLGGALSVTGSKYLLEIDEYKLLVDCGLFQGPKALRLRNWHAFPVDPSTIAAVIITHAHIDHTGYLPRLVKEGFNGPVYCTDATADLTEILLLDSAKLQEEEADFARKKGYSRHEYPQPLYGVSDAEKALSLLKGFPYRQRVVINDRLEVRFQDAGHILGSAIVELFIKGKSQEKKVVFSGDLGRYEQAVFNDPASVRFADILFVESTYGNRSRLEVDLESELATIVNESQQRKGCLLIPAFAVGRTQTVIYHLHQLMKKSKIPEMPVFIDSPMAINVTRLYKQYSSYHKLRGSRPASIFDDKRLFYYRSREESASLNERKNNAIIISASGMVTGGRILHHMYHHLKRENDTVLFVGYQAKGTRGRTIMEQQPTVKMFGVQVPIRCNIRTIDGLSAHADQEELMRWLGNYKNGPKRTFVVHGEPESANTLVSKIREKLKWHNVYAPDYLESFELFDEL